MIWSALVVITVLYFINWYFRTREFRRKISQIKCEPNLPFLGHVLKLGIDSGELLNSLEHMWNNLGRDKFLLKLGPLDQVVITHPDDLEVILSTSDLIEKNVLYGILSDWIGTGLVTSGGAKWRLHRKMLTPAFHFKVLQTYVEVYEDDAKAYVKEVLKTQQQDTEITDLISSGTLSSIARSALGLSFVSKDDMAAFKNSTSRIENILNEKMFSFWKRIEIFYKLTNEHKELKRHLDNVHLILLKICNKKREELKDVIEAVSSGKTTIEELTTVENEFTKKKLSFIEILLLCRKPNGQPLSAKEIDDEVNTFMVAGYQTPSTLISFMLHVLAQHPEVQDKIYEEQLDITNGDLSKPLTYSDIQSMKYLDRVMKETMRLYPPAPFFGRLITRDTLLKDGTELPEGCSVLMFPYLTHRNPDIFKDPMKFDPDRFLENSTNVYTYYPFSAGPRNCIGQKLANTLIKSWISTIFRSCKVRPSVNNKSISLDLNLVLKSKNGVHLQYVKK